MITIYIVALLQSLHVNCFWPPPYEAKFEDKDNFVISVEASEDEEEMIKKTDITALNLDIDSRKMERLHKQFKTREKRDEILKPRFVDKLHGSLKIW